MDVNQRINKARTAGKEWEHCGCCEEYHPIGFTGDCRDDSNRIPVNPRECESCFEVTKQLSHYTTKGADVWLCVSCMK